MPIFDYECPECKIQREFLVNKNTHVICELCNSDMIKLPSAPRGKVVGSDNPVKQ